MSLATPSSTTYNSNANVTYTAGAAIAAFLRCYIDSAGVAQIAGATIVGDLVSMEAIASGDQGNFRFLNAEGSTILTASGAVTKGDDLLRFLLSLRGDLGLDVVEFLERIGGAFLGGLRYLLTLIELDEHLGQRVRVARNRDDDIVRQSGRDRFDCAGHRLTLQEEYG